MQHASRLGNDADMERIAPHQHAVEDAFLTGGDLDPMAKFRVAQCRGLTAVDRGCVVLIKGRQIDAAQFAKHQTKEAPAIAAREVAALFYKGNPDKAIELAQMNSPGKLAGSKVPAGNPSLASASIATSNVS